MPANFDLDRFDFRRPVELARATPAQQPATPRGVAVRVRVVAVQVQGEPCDDPAMTIRAVLLAVLVIVGAGCAPADNRDGDNASLHTLATCGSGWARFGYTGSAQCERACVDAFDETGPGCMAYGWQSSTAAECQTTFDFEGVEGCCLGGGASTHPVFLACE